MKDIAKHVGVHTSLLHYYFDDKERLFETVIGRRAPQVNEARLEALDRYENEVGDAITVEGVLQAILDTNLDVYDNGEAWRNYGALGSVLNATPELGARLMDDNFDAVAVRLIKLLGRAMPDCPEEDLYWGFHFMSGSLMLTLARTGRIDRLSGGLCNSDDFGAVKERMSMFMAAGFKAVCRERAAARAAAKGSAGGHRG